MKNINIKILRINDIGSESSTLGSNAFHYSFRIFLCKEKYHFSICLFDSIHKCYSIVDAINFIFTYYLTIIKLTFKYVKFVRTIICSCHIERILIYSNCSIYIEWRYILSEFVFSDCVNVGFNISIKRCIKGNIIF